ncbi:MAG: toll/interleukin-1 receptor domain-containing protein [Bacteroidales bacterium]|jgi:cell division protein FtsB|nr:toll/interleukin-1 receptor domain-containing protein [Bacteroidales bacterium]
MGKSVLVFISHSSEDKESLIEPIVSDLEDCFINVWIDKRKILPGDNLRKSIFRDGLDKADIALIFFTEKSLQSSWVDREIKHVLREESKKGNDFDLNKIISIFDSSETYEQIAKRYPELTDDLCHLMPENYDKIQLGKLVSAIWSKYLSLQGGDIETQRQLLEKDKEIFQKEKEIERLARENAELKTKDVDDFYDEVNEFGKIVDSGVLAGFIDSKEYLLSSGFPESKNILNLPEAIAFGLVEFDTSNYDYVHITDKGKDFFKFLILNIK